MADLKTASLTMKRESFCFLPGPSTFSAVSNHDGFAEFSQIWSDLPADPYVTTEPSYRFRRHARAAFDPGTAELRVLPDGEYLQTAAHNPLFGGMSRQFAAVPWTAGTRAVLGSLIEISASQVLELPGPSLVNVHLVRIVGGPGRPGRPAPEGPHRDGFDYISVHLLGRAVDDGGETSVLDDTGTVLGTVTLRDPLDAIYVDDRRLRHYTSPIVATGRPAFRDVLLMSFQPYR